MKTHFSNKSGFTLIEILVSLGVIGILIVMATTIFVTTIQNARKAEIINEARQNASLVIDSIQKEVRGATSVEVFDSILAIPASLGVPGDELVITSSKGDRIWRCRPPSGTKNASLTKEVISPPIPEKSVTNLDPITGVSINNCAFIMTSRNVVSVRFDVNEGFEVQNAANEYQVNLHFETTATTRRY